MEDACVFSVGVWGGGQKDNMGILISPYQRGSIHSKLICTVCVTCRSWPVLKFLAICSAVFCGIATSCSPSSLARLSKAPTTLFSSCPSLDHFWYILITAYWEQPTAFWQMVWSSHLASLISALFKVTLILKLVHFSSFQLINLMNWRVTCCRIYTTPWQVPQ